MAERRTKTMRDMALTMGVVIVVILGLALFDGGFTFAPGGATAGPPPTADVAGGFSHAHEVLTFPIVIPKGIPADWHPNSFAIVNPQVDGMDKVPAVRGGWITPAGAFVMLAETSGSVSQTLDQEIGSAGPDNGTVKAGGFDWTVTTGVRNEVAWVRTQATTTYLITGNANIAAFATVAGSLSG